MDIKPYKKDSEYSYTLGAFPTFELLKTHPEKVITVLVHSTFTDKEGIHEICDPAGIPVEINDKVINKLSDKENCFVIGVFNKFSNKLDETKSHICLVNPGNMGNLGTIIRSGIGFGYKNLAIIAPGCDVFNPKAIRASMGAAFRMNIQYFESFEEYEKQFPDHDIYCFMLNAKRQLKLGDEHPKAKYTLVFGNEATGLPDEFLEKGTSVIIPQSDEVDSLNITIAAGVGMYVFANSLSM